MTPRLTSKKVPKGNPPTHIERTRSNDALFEVDISFPETSSPEGKVKFVDRGVGRGTELGFLVKSRMDKLDVTKLPAKYRKTEQRGELTIEPTDTVGVYGASRIHAQRRRWICPDDNEE